MALDQRLFFVRPLSSWHVWLGSFSTVGRQAYLRAMIVFSHREPCFSALSWFSQLSDWTLHLVIPLHKQRLKWYLSVTRCKQLLVRSLWETRGKDSPGRVSLTKTSLAFFVPYLPSWESFTSFLFSFYYNTANRHSYYTKTAWSLALEAVNS